MNFEEEKVLEKYKKESEMKEYMRKYIASDEPTFTKRTFIQYNEDGSIKSQTDYVKYGNNKKWKRMNRVAE
jgi:hypothetical protein